jgi:hypothetical protein
MSADRPVAATAATDTGVEPARTNPARSPDAASEATRADRSTSAEAAAGHTTEPGDHPGITGRFAGFAATGDTGTDRILAPIAGPPGCGADNAGAPATTVAANTSDSPNADRPARRRRTHTSDSNPDTRTSPVCGSDHTALRCRCACGDLQAAATSPATDAQDAQANLCIC